MGKIVDHLDLQSIDAVNTLKAELFKRRRWTSQAWDDLCWPFFDRGFTAVTTAQEIGYKKRNISVEKSRQRYQTAKGLPRRGRAIFERYVPTVKNSVTQKRKKKITEITTELALTRKLYALFSHISLVEISTQLTNNQRDALMLFAQAMEESWQKERM